MKSNPIRFFDYRGKKSEEEFKKELETKYNIKHMPFELKTNKNDEIRMKYEEQINRLNKKMEEEEISNKAKQKEEIPEEKFVDSLPQEPNFDHLMKEEMGKFFYIKDQTTNKVPGLDITINEKEQQNPDIVKDPFYNNFYKKKVEENQNKGFDLANFVSASIKKQKEQENPNEVLKSNKQVRLNTSSPLNYISSGENDDLINQKRGTREILTRDTLLCLKSREGDPIIDIKHNGDIFVRGELITVDGVLVEGLREFLKNNKFIP